MVMFKNKLYNIWKQVLIINQSKYKEPFDLVKCLILIISFLDCLTSYRNDFIKIQG